MAATAARAETAPPPTHTDPTPGDWILPQIVTAAARERKLALITWDDGRRYELIDGEEVVSPSPIPDHQRVLRTFFRSLDGFVAPRGLGEVFTSPIDVYLGEYGVVVPDLVFVASDRVDIVGAKRIDGPPDLVIEILSPSTRRDDLGRKLTAYAAAGVKEYWVVDLLNRRVDAHTLVGNSFVLIPEAADGTIASRVLPGLVIDVVELFSDI